MFNHREGINRLEAIGLPHEVACALISEVALWAKNSGEEWTCGRLKVLKQDFLRHLVGLPPTEESETHVRIKRRADGTPVGIFGFLWRLPKGKAKVAWNSLMVYSGLRYTGGYRVTTRQLLKFEAALSRPEPTAFAMVYAKDMLDRGRHHAVTVGEPSRLYGYVPRDRHAPLFFFTKKEAEVVVNSLLALELAGGWCLENTELVSELTYGIPDFWDRAMRTRDTTELVTGSLGWLQEPGYKLRFIANPMRCFQQMLSPLKDAVFEALAHSPWDYTFRQDDCIPYAQAQLNAGRTCYSFDLRNATDHFPLDLQLYQLRTLGVPEMWVRAYRDISRGAFLTMDPRQPRRDRSNARIRFDGGDRATVEMKAYWWDVGGPLGLGPVFGTFAMAHESLILGLFRAAHIEPRFMVLGDDVAIFDATVSAMYSKVLSDLGVPISLEKTLVSSDACEFAGRVIFKDSVLRGYKWKGYNNDSFVEVARHLGPSSLPLFTPRQRSVLLHLGPVPEPYGLGWNPLGKPYEERIGAWDKLPVPLEPDPLVPRLGRNANVLQYAPEHVWYTFTCVEDSEQELRNWSNDYLPGLPPEISASVAMRQGHRLDTYLRSFIATGDPAYSEKVAMKDSIRVLEARIASEKRTRTRLDTYRETNAIAREIQRASADPDA